MFSLYIVSISFDFRRDILINRAVRKIISNKSLLTIAIVGSYGRGSTKEFISRVLSKKYNVLSTKASFTSTFGIAKTILSELSPKRQIFIAEIDDFKKEDVVEMCEIISPKITVVTGVNEQKLSLFGSMDKIVESKEEAINALSRDGIAIFNGNSGYISKLISGKKQKKFIYSIGSSEKNSSIRAVKIQESKLSLSFDVLFLGKKYSFSNIKLLGRQNIENLLPGIFIGIYMGIDSAVVKKALSELRPLDGAMSPKVTKSGVMLIDDTYNANINSVKKVLSYMKLYSGQKILVLEPLLELGKNSGEVHKTLGREIAKVCDILFLTNSNNIKNIERGIEASGKKIEVKVLSPAGISRFVNNYSRKGDVVVFEGKEARLALKGIKSTSPFETQA
jgi:UDP-N-acetylmuramoyl-tripeptide--D-alanyl-D-alanine ligase